MKYIIEVNMSKGWEIVEETDDYDFAMERFQKEVRLSHDEVAFQPVRLTVEKED